MLNQNTIKNQQFYSLITLVLYLLAFNLLAAKLDFFFQPAVGVVVLISAFLADFYFTRKRLRIYLRFLIILGIYFFMRQMIYLVSFYASPADTYNYFDKIPILFSRDTAVAFLFILFYFIFDAIRVFKKKLFNYLISTLVLLLLFYFIFMLNNQEIQKTFFQNYLNYAFYLLIVLSLLILRHFFLLPKYYEKAGFKERPVVINIFTASHLLFPDDHYLRFSYAKYCRQSLRRK
ncbi:MAG: hypothetical protein MJB14_05530 [Spirochaetes bacterium]|nr:hypothetical protein [Spirochaetota bacterium]